MSRTQEFNGTITRDRAAADYFSSQAFLDTASKAIQCAVIKNGRKSAYLTASSTDIRAASKDMPYIQEAFKTLKEKFPDLNHVHYGAGGDIYFDTRKPSLMTQLSAAVRKYAL